jgi:hypothetical protein
VSRRPPQADPAVFVVGAGVVAVPARVIVPGFHLHHLTPWAAPGRLPARPGGSPPARTAEWRGLPQAGHLVY